MVRRVIAFALLIAAPAQAAAPIGGRWFTEAKDSIVEISSCGAALCGKIVRILIPPPDGRPAIDRNNPDPALRTRPILGLTLLSGFRDGGGEWTGGTIYDPRAGRSYKARLARLTNGTLKVTGCVGPFCRSVIFTPAK